MRVIFAGGGTGGHVYPSIAVAEELSSRRAAFEALFVGTRRGVETRVVPRAGYELRFISSRGARGGGVAGKVAAAAMLAVGVVQSLGIISSFNPDLVYGSGGYASVAVVAAAWLSRRTVVLQEQNSVPGLANRLLARIAKRIYLGFEGSREHFGSRASLMVTGNPIRRSIKWGRDAAARGSFGLSAGRPVLLVFGGSQGAISLSRAAVRYILAREEVQAIVQTGERAYDEIRRVLAGASDRVYISPYLEEMGSAYAASDVALSRAGALSVSELAAAGLPSVLVPYPHCADDHQTRNARIMVDEGGALMIEDSGLGGSSLAAALDSLIEDTDLRGRMQASLARLRTGSPAAVTIAGDMESLAGGAGGLSGGGNVR